MSSNGVAARRPSRGRGPRRVLFVAHSSLEGGAEYCLDTTLRHLDRARLSATVLFPFEGPMSESARSMGFEVLIAPLCHWVNTVKTRWYWKNLVGRLLPHVLHLWHVIRRYNIELVYSNTVAIFESALAARLARVPHLWHVHEILKVGNSMHQLLPLPVLKRLMYRLSDALVFESHSSRRVFEESTPSDRSHVVYNSLRLRPEAAAERGANRAAYGLRPGDRVVGFIGQLIDRKNPLLLVRALARLKDVPDLKCLFVGDGALAGPLRQAIRAAGLNGACRVIGFQRDVGRVLNCLDVLVLPSRQESFGLVLAEAGAHGIPAIACSSEGPSEIIVPGETGFLVGQDDDAGLADKLGLLLASAGERARMGTAAARRVDDLFSPESNTRKLESVVEAVLRARAGAGRRARRRDDTALPAPEYFGVPSR